MDRRRFSSREAWWSISANDSSRAQRGRRRQHKQQAQLGRGIAADAHLLVVEQLCSAPRTRGCHFTCSGARCGATACASPAASCGNAESHNRGSCEYAPCVRREAPSSGTHGHKCDRISIRTIANVARSRGCRWRGSGCGGSEDCCFPCIVAWCERRQGCQGACRCATFARRLACTRPEGC